ncbi:MAG: (2Fe-2S) ferredoxin domain-containing protein, partial [Candidatus Desulforudis sp.]|nr:(2Fe-2S) ferredoxin domain-containing protein [Desulforudis sp.]
MIRSTNDLQAIKDRHLPLVEERLQDGRVARPTQVLVCTSTACQSSGGEQAYKFLRREVKELGLDVRVVKTGCYGFCGLGPVAVVHQGAILYCR